MKRIALPTLVLLVLIGSLCFVGCETESASQNNVVISPRSAIILIDQAIELTASGGFDYEWSLENEEWGTLSTTKGNRTVYTSAYDPATNWQEHQVVTVTSYINKQSGTNITGFTDYYQTAEAVITHQTRHVLVTITPSTASSVSNRGDSVSFTASGANTYTWGLQHEDWGLLSTRSGPTTTYTSRREVADGGEDDIQVLTCTTDRGTTAVHIIHESEPATP